MIWTYDNIWRFPKSSNYLQLSSMDLDGSSSLPSINWGTHQAIALRDAPNLTQIGWFHGRFSSLGSQIADIDHNWATLKWKFDILYIYIYKYILMQHIYIYICIGCSLTSVTVGKLIFYENPLQKEHKEFHAFFHLFFVQKLCSKSCCFGAPLRAKIMLYIVLFWCSPPCKNRALHRAVLVLPSVQKSCSKSCCFGAPLRAKIVL